MNLNIKNNVIDKIRKNGAIILDYNGVLYDKEVKEKALYLIVQLLNKGFCIAINTNNNIRELIPGQFCKLYYRGTYFMNFVNINYRSNLVIYADNRVNKYLYINNGFSKDLNYCIDKRLNTQQRIQIMERVKSLLYKYAKNNYFNFILNGESTFPSYKIIDTREQIAIKMKLPSNYSFGVHLKNKLYEDIKEDIEIHLGRHGLYISKSGLKKSFAVKDFVQTMKKEPNWIYYIGDKFNENYDSDLWAITECNINGVNVGDKNVSRDNIINLGMGVHGTTLFLEQVLINMFFKTNNCEVLDLYEFINILLKKYNANNYFLTVAINGPTGSGKSSFSHNIMKILREQGIQVELIHFDDFMKSRKERSELIEFIDESNIEEYYKMAWNNKLLKTVLLRIINKDGEDFDLDNLYNRCTGGYDKKRTFYSIEKGIVILEGTEAFNEETENLMDVSVMLFANEKESISRLFNRNKDNIEKGNVSYAELCYRYVKIDSIHRKYILKDPFSNYDFIIDYTDWNLPCIFMEK